ncbi:MAG: hypothetical protein KGL39_39275 [Patescibacteria group bacterium]|nr:hypothetical protein [Patescibacteria group bacterium]
MMSAIGIPPQLTRQTSSQRLARTPQPGESILDTTDGNLYAGDGATPGGVAVGSNPIANLGVQSMTVFNADGSIVTQDANGNTRTINFPSSGLFASAVYTSGSMRAVVSYSFDASSNLVRTVQ